MRALWKGSISFGLVHIPVKMYTASHEKEFKFTMLHKKDLSEVRYARMCKVEDKEVPWDEIVKGYEYSPGEYVVLTDEDFKKINLEKSKSIEILHFIDEGEIDTVYYTRPYFLEPEKTAAKAYSLLLEALRKSRKVGIAKFVLHNREHLAVIKPYGHAIILNELRYAAELNKINEIEVPELKADAKELAVAIKLIDQLTTDFKPSEYKDTYAKEVKEMIEKKAKGKRIATKGHEVKKPTKVHDIMSLLKASLEEEKPKKTVSKSQKKPLRRKRG